ncbi:DUF1820 family protein [Marinicella sp. S1101]|uniref:DUF1820 family protein n=1 Tax=Marinicella marina TaxID=2996016 RepID=UPI002260B91F|nr:DUF1820 family protein [Marinicella marina]MCX7552791.1 DUF1820 family protein [Marinicella marina]MDJ1139900.1 DUF1820 family protein [Marinicella marina]
MKNHKIYRINYNTNQEVYELYAKAVNTQELLGFISISDLLFDQQSGVVIDPTEERLKTEFKGVKTLHLPIQNVLKIEEVEQKKSCKIKTLKKDINLTAIPNQPGPK